MHNGITMTAICLLTLAAHPASAQQAGPDTRDWACEFCPPVEQLFGSLWLGPGWVDDASDKYSQYTALNRGGFLDAGGTVVRTTATDYWRLDVHQPGLRSRQVSLDGGAAGRYRLRLRYSELPQRIADSTVTVYPNAGADRLTLPTDWVRAPNTQSMTRLAASLRPLRLGQNRERFGLGLDLTPAGNWRYKLDYQHETKDGVRATAGAFLFVSALLPTPLDQVTDQVHASATYSADSWQTELTYDGSFFDNKSQSLTWESAFNPLVPGAASGQLALAPDNEYHRLGIAGSYRLTESMGLSARLGVGRMSQDDAFAPYTLNANLRAAALPMPDLNGEVDLIDFSAQLIARPGARSRVKVKLDYYERDNNSPVAQFQPVTMDLFVNPARRNQPYSYDRQSLGAEGSHRIGRSLRLAGGVEYEQMARSREAAADTDEQSAWARLRFDLGQYVDANLKLGYSRRDGDELSPAAVLAANENPLLRKFQYADRDREDARLTVSITPHEKVQLALSGGHSADDYDHSALGLNDSDATDFNADLSFVASTTTSMHAFYSREKISSRITGSAAFADPDWFGETEDRIRSAGAGVTLHNLAEREIDLSLDYVFSRATGIYRIDTAQETAPFPDLNTRLEGIRLRFSVPVGGASQLRLDYYHERFSSSDWALDGVAPDAVFNLLTLGETSPDYNVDSIALSYRTSF